MIVLELAESFLPRECSGAERDGWGDDRGLAAKRRKGRKNRIDDGKADAGGRRAEGWPTEHTEHTEGFLTGGNGVNGGRRVRPVPNPRAGKPVPRGMGFPAHVGATADRAGRV